MNVGSLFSGIGGFDLGLERAGMRTSWFCEQDEFCQRVLAHHWPGVPVYDDVCALRGADVEPVDVLCGGFPCQDLSYAGAGAGLAGARSGLWSEYARLIGELRPRYVVVENVAALLARGLGTVLGDLAALGYDAEWDCLPASAFGAPHRRDRIWLVAYPGGEQHEGPGAAQRGQAAQGLPQADPDAHGGGCEAGPEPHREQVGPGLGASLGDDADGLRDALADPDRVRCAEGLREPAGRVERSRQADPLGSGELLADADRRRREGRAGKLRASQRDESADGGSGELQDADERALLPWRVGGRASQAGGPEWWSVEPPVGRVAHGVPNRLDQLAALGNALVPQIAEWIGRRILEAEGRMNHVHPLGQVDS